MPNVATIEEVYDVVQGDKVPCAVSLDAPLDSGVTLDSATATEVTTSDLTISAVTVTADAKDINGRSVAAGRAVTFSVATSGVTLTSGKPKTYRVRVVGTYDTDHTVTRDVLIRVVAKGSN